MTDTTRQGPLTWGQELLWLGYLASPPERRNGHTVVQRFDLPPDASAAAVAAALDALVDRHESLRTTFHLPPDGAAYQVVHAPRPVPLERVPGGPDAEADTIARLKEIGFDLAEEGLVRAALVLDGSAPVALYVATHHITVDGWSWGVLRRELDALVRGEPLPPVPWQPLDQAEYERSARGQQANEAALRYWERQIAIMPDRVLVGAGGEPGQHLVVLDSPALSAAIAYLGRRYQVVDSTLLIAALAGVLGHVTGREQSIVMTMSSNRLSPRTRDLVACLAQYTVVNLDLRGDPTFTELVRRAGAAMMTAYRYGQYDFQEMKARERAIAEQRGLAFSQPAGLNLRRYTDQPPERGEPGPPPALSRADTTVRVQPIGGSCARGVVLLSVRPRSDQTELELLCDGAALPAEDLTRLVQAVETLLVDAVADPELRLSTLADRCGLRPPALGADWALVDNCWVNLREIEQALRAYPGVTAALAVHGEELVGYLATDDPADPSELRTHLAEAARGGLAVVAPHRFVTVRTAPTDVHDQAAWERQEPATSR